MQIRVLVAFVISVVATVGLTVATAYAAPPNAPDVDRSTITGELLTSPIQATDPDPGTELTYEQLTDPQRGSATVRANGTFTYRSESDFTGIDSFTYQVCDDGDPVACDTGTITVTVYPLARGDRAVTRVDTSVRVAVLDNDTDGAVVTSTSTGPSNGSAAIGADGVITYTPDAGYVGVDAFSYTICSPTASEVCHGNRVQILVRPVNRSPTLDDELLVTDVGSAVGGRATGTDPDGDELSYRRTSAPAHGTATVEPDGRLRYAPAPGYAGHDRFGVEVCDDGLPRRCASAVVRVDVYPVAVDDRARTDEGSAVTVDVVANDRGRHAPPRVVDGPGSGTAEVRGGAVVYTPDPGFTGTDTFDYRLCTPAPGPLCRTATVTVRVTAADDDGTGGAAGADPTVGVLPDTGGPSGWLLAAGLLLLGAGAGLVRRATADPDLRG